MKMEGEENINPNTTATMNKSSIGQAEMTSKTLSSADPETQHECVSASATGSAKKTTEPVNESSSNTSHTPTIKSQLNTTCVTTASTVSTTASASPTPTPHPSTTSNNLKQQQNNDCATMTLTISASNAQRMLEASHVLNSTLFKLQKENDSNNTKEKKIDKSQDENDNYTSNDKDDNNNPSPSSLSSSPSTILTSTALSKLLMSALPSASSPSSTSSSTSPSGVVCSSNNTIHRNKLLSTFITSMQNDIRKQLLTQEEMLISLLLFIDLDKSNKLLTAFEILVNGEDSKGSVKQVDTVDNESEDLDHGNDEDNDTNNPSSSPSTTTTKKATKTLPPSLNRNQLRKLFQSFLISISTCINYKTKNDDDGKDDNNKPIQNDNSGKTTTASISTALPSNKVRKMQKDDSPHSTMNQKDGERYNTDNAKKLISDDTRREIEEIANYAANKVIKDIRQKQSSSSNTATTATTTVGEEDDTKDTHTFMDEHHFVSDVTFQEFGEWYNTGGFSLVPWLELLDLAKWDHAGRTAAAAVASTKTKAVPKSTNKGKQDAKEDVGMIDNVAKQQHNQHLFKDNDNGLSPALSDLFFKSPLPFKQAQTITHPTMHHFHHQMTMPSSYSVKQQTDYLHQPLISFEFPSSFIKARISLTRENILQLQHIVAITGFSSRSPKQVANVILRQSHKREINIASSSSSAFHREPYVWVINRKDFNKCILDLIPTDILRRLPKSEMDYVMNRFNNFFSCYAMANNTNKTNVEDFVNGKELAVGLSFLCVGNKSAKLASTFELIGDPNYAFLSSATLMQYFRSYLTMLVGISLLSSSERITIETSQALVALGRSHGNNAMVNQVSRLYDIIEAGAKSTMDHFHKKHNSSSIYFEDLASWYTDGGYTIANWLEFLDLRKFASLLNEKEKKNLTRPPKSNNVLTETPRNPHPSRIFDECFALSPASKKGDNKPLPSTRKPTPDEILFSFPLANKQSLVVLKEDASYVRTVVDHLGLLDISPENVWKTLSKLARKNQPIDASKDVSASRVGVKVSQQTFVQAVQKVLPLPNKRKRSTTETDFPSSAEDTLKNFYHSFDLDQINDVAANQLMGGLTLLCGGKKSAKLSFAFGLFDVRNLNSGKGKTKKAKRKKQGEEETSLCGKELFYFFRSFLIVMFSCCKQSLDLSADAVFRYISDTANKVTDDVMKYQWKVRRMERVNFDDFGEWYNEGGFEAAPWLELLDLNKWVLLDEEKADKLLKESKPMQRSQTNASSEMAKKLELSPKITQVKGASTQNCPPAPPDDELDPHSDPFLDDIEMDGIGGDIGDMAFLFSEGIGKDIDDPLQEPNQCTKASGPSPYRTSVKEQEAKPLKFHLYTNESTMYTVSINQKRVLLLKRLVVESNLCNTTFSAACETILEDYSGKQITRKRFNSAMQSILNYSNMSTETSSLLFELFGIIFKEFDSNKVGKADAIELACGLTVLCGGRKSDKLEYAFELLSKKKKRLLSRFQMVRYLQSFLLVLLSISSCALGPNESQEILFSEDGEKPEGNIALARVICATSSWVTEEIFKSTSNDKKQIIDGAEYIDFDKFADWYTRGGFNHIAWLELLDLRKWVLVDS